MSPRQRNRQESAFQRAVLWIGVSALVLSACSREPIPAPSLVLITIDYLAADHLSCFGGPADNGKSLCEIAEGGTLMAWAVSPGYGLASTIASVLTGTPEAVHGMDDRGLSFLPDGQTTIAEALLAREYRTAAFVTSPALNLSRRLDQGFEQYELFPDAGPPLQQAVEAFIGQSEEPYFAWIHLTQPTHTNPREGLAEIDRSVAGLGGVLRRDERSPALMLSALRGLPDHVAGIGLASHRVPIIWRPPNNPSTQPIPRVRFEAVSLIDIAPTLASAAGTTVHADLELNWTRGVIIGTESKSMNDRFLLLADGGGRKAKGNKSPQEEVGLVSGTFFYVRSRSELDGTGQPLQNPELAAQKARFVSSSPMHPGRAHLTYSPWRQDVLAKDSPVPRLEFHLARKLQERSLRSPIGR